ncbi:hypothetical protein SDC9_56413 [bioreactor metagenome]|uniref:Uncharacterized protein n=1 Tax=bioreactor metagenome TaxID=1076179 RepID=A0A644X1X1_9ZZZZ
MDISKQRTPIIVLIAILWLACIITGTTGHFVIGMCLGVVLMFLHLLLGISKKGIVSKKFLIYPILCWAALWIVSFILSGYYATLFAGKMPTFTVFGLHPSFAPTVFLYWIGGQLTLNLGLYLLQDEWLSQKDWDDFCDEIKKLDADKKGVK